MSLSQCALPPYSSRPAAEAFFSAIARYDRAIAIQPVDGSAWYNKANSVYKFTTA